jgi:hypothetical protein
MASASMDSYSGRVFSPLLGDRRSSVTPHEQSAGELGDSRRGRARTRRNERFESDAALESIRESRRRELT